MKFVLILALGGLVSCASNNLSQKSAPLNVSLKSNLHADIDVDMQKKIVGKAHHMRIFGIHTQSSTNYADGVTYEGSSQGGGFGFFGPGMEEEAKSAAAYNATVPHKVDVLVAPQYLVKVNSFLFGLFKEVHVQVWGYGGKIRNIRQTTDRPAQLAGAQ